MAPLTFLTQQFSVAGQLTPADIAEAAARGFKTIINFRPDNEAAGQASSFEAQRAAAVVGLGYAHVPAQKYDLFNSDIVSAAQRAFAHAKGPVLAFCGSGQRAAILWAAVQARSTPINGILETLSAAGFQLDFLRDDLEAQADRARWLPDDASHDAPSQPAAAPREAA